MSTIVATFTTVKCDLADCRAELTTRHRLGDFWQAALSWGWRKVLSTSPHPQPEGQWAWAITLHFCPEHAHLADQPDAYTVARHQHHREQANYTATLIDVKPETQCGHSLATCHTDRCFLGATV